MTNQPTNGDKLSAALDNFARAARNATLTLNVQAAMGHVWTGDHDRAREALRRIPADRLPDLILASIGLSALAEEIAAEGPTQ